MTIGKWALGLVALFALVLCIGRVSAAPPWVRSFASGRPSFDRLLDAFDDNDDGALEEDEVPARVWMRLKAADANGDGVVTRKEFDAYKPGGGKKQ